MAQKQTSPTAWLRQNTIGIVRVHLALAALYAVFILASDAWNLVTREVTWWRWEMFGAFLIVTAAVGFLARAKTKQTVYYRALIIAMVLLDVALATFVVYTERGMASRGVMLYALAVGTAGSLRSRSGIIAAGIVSAGAYVLAATRYFYVFFNEGYKAELYTTLALYGGAFLVLAFLLHIAIGPKEGE
jgi:hypothetical protein